MTSKNSMLHKASWLGFKIDFWKFIESLGHGVAGFAIEKREQHEEEQDTVLHAFEKNYLSKDAKKED